MDPRRLLVALAALNVAVHVAEVALAATVMVPGSRDAALAERMAWLAARPPAWTLSWAVWGGSAVVDVAWVAHLGTWVRGDRWWAGVAVALVAVGAAVDLSLDVLHVAVNPGLAARGAVDLFLAFEQVAWTVGAAVANPAYCAGTALVTGALARDGRVGGLTVGLAAATALFGASLSLAALFADPAWIPVTAGPTIACFVAWTLAGVRDLLTR